LAEHDDAQKTEQPTPRRLEQGREKGQVPVSQEVKTWASLAAGALTIAVAAPFAAQRLLPILMRFIEAPETMHLDADALQPAVLSILLPLAGALAALLVPIALAVVLAAVAQSGLIWAPAKIQPQLGNLSPAKGLKRMVSAPALAEFVKGLLKITTVGIVVAWVSLPLLREVGVLADLPLSGLIFHTHHLFIALLSATAVVMTAVAALDYGFQRLNFLRQMRMTRQEVRDEYKDSEGDPHIKARIRRIRAERARKRMMAAVPKATVVVTNPTHYAVALLYEAATMSTPKVVAKGSDAVAQRIRAVAEASDVPIVENPPLARSLFATVDIDAEIPPQHYQAVAQVISYLLRRGQLRGAVQTAGAR
jgi:flagellar biosynthetic protein FlhB